MVYRQVAQTSKYVAYQPTKAEVAPRFLYPIAGGRQGGRLKSPMGICVKDGTVYMTSADSRLVIARFDGGYLDEIALSKFGRKGSPRAVAVDDAGRVYITFGQENSILVLDSRGRLVNGSFGSGPLKDPVGLDYRRNRVYVTDVGDHTVKVFTVRGEPVAQFGGLGGGEGRFQYPNGVTVVESGKIYVADSNNSRVQIFNSANKVLGTLPQPPDERDRILLPRSVAVDKLGRIHVVDTLRSLVHVYDKHQKYLFKYGQEGAAAQKLSYPNSIFIDRDTGLIFIADRLNNRIAVWAEN